MSSDPALQESLTIGSRRARVAAALLALTTAVSLAQAVAYWSLAASLQQRACAGTSMYSQVCASIHAIANTSYTMRLMLLLPTAFAFLYWLHRAVLNARLVNPDFVGVAPGEAVAAFFIPIVNLVRPIAVVRAVDRAVDPEQLPLPETWVENRSADYRSPARQRVVVPWVRVKAPIAAWWTFWILSNLGGYFVAIGGIYSLFVLRLLHAIAGVFAIGVVRGIDARTIEHARRRAALPQEPAPVVL
jgi:hypothetical protein